MKKYLHILFTWLIFANTALGQVTELNYSKVTKPLKAVSTEVDLKNTTENETRVVEAYSDKLGRPMIDVVRRITPDEHHLVQYHDYDHLGREAKVYLPYSSRMDSLNAEYGYGEVYGVPPTQYDPWSSHIAYFESLQQSFYNAGNQFPNIAQNYNPSSERVFEDDPKGRLVEQSAPGYSWRLDDHKTERYTYRANYASDVWELEIGANTYDIIKKVPYAKSKIYVVEKRDADNRLTASYTDISGKLLMTAKLLGNNQLSKTYYVYNKLGQLCYVLPPEGVKAAGSVNYGTVIPATILAKWAFSYRYNSRGQLIEKKMPGIAPIYYIYDTKGRVVLVQDGKQRLDNKWNFIKYDQANRPIISGLYQHSSSLNLENMQNFINTQVGSFERRSKTNYASNFGYTDITFPTISSNPDVEVLGINYYDDYDFNFDGTRDYSYLSEVEFNGQAAFYRNRGIATGNKVKVLGTSGSAEWINSVIFYDDRGRVIQTFKDYGNSETERATLKYDFEGKVLNSKSVHIRPAPPISNITSVTIRNRYVYDHAGRLVKLYKKMNEQPEVLLAQYEYNELSQLITKKIHSRTEKVTPPTNYKPRFLQEVNYKYNERGWLTKINDADLTKTKDLFGLELNYNEPGPLGAAAQYSGNIASMAWKSRSDETRRNFAYSYDGTGQLTRARYADGNQTLSAIDRYSLSALTYDENGNIKSLRRRGYVQSGYPGGGGEASRLVEDPNAYYHIIDKLDYTYDGNKLLAVSDSVRNNSNSMRIDFNDRKTLATEYTYDANGNMQKDENKGIVTDIVYNVLNLPQEITFATGNKLNFKYDALGNKLYQEMISGGARVSWTTYRSWDTFENDISGIINTEEGRLITGNENYWDYEYNYADHLGNIRLTYGEKKEITELKLTLENGPNNEVKSIEQTNFKNYSQNLGEGIAHTGVYSVKVTNLDGPEIKSPLQVKSGDKVDLNVWYFHNNPPSPGGGWESRAQNPNSNSPLPSITKPALALGVGLIPLGPNNKDQNKGEVDNRSGNYMPAAQLNIIGGLTYLWAATSSSSKVIARQSQTQALAPENSAELLSTGEPIYSPPKAYLVWEIWKSDETVVLNQGRTRVQYIPNGNWQELKLNLEIDLSEFADTTGKLVVKLENLDGTDVWFDDLVIKHTRRDKVEIVQADHYDPFGLMIPDLSYRKPNEIFNKQLFNAGSEWQKDLQWYSTFYRQYDPQIGRFQQYDPSAENYFSLAPYQYAGNNPITFNDPLGDVFIEMHSDDGDGGGGPRIFPWGPADDSNDNSDNTSNNSPGYNVIPYTSSYYGVVFNNTPPSGELPAYGGGHGGGKGGNKPKFQKPNSIQPSRGLGELASSSSYTIRNKDVNGWTLFNEFWDGTGPEYSIFTEGHPMVADLKNSWIIGIANAKFIVGGQKPLLKYDVPFGLAGIPLSHSWSEQIIGGARVTIIPIGAGRLYIVDNTMGRYSFRLHLAEDISRVSGTITPEGTTYQRFIWFDK